MIKQLNKIQLIFECNETEVISEFALKLEKFFSNQDVDSYFNIEYNNLELILLTKEELDKEILKVSTSYKDAVPEWVVGFTTEKRSYIVFPEKNKIDYYVQLALHELVHLLIYKLNINGKRSKLLEEGLATYISNQMTQAQFQKIVQDYKNNSLKKLFDLSKYDSKEFGENNGYYYSFFLIKFLKNNYSKEKIIYYIMNSDEFESNLGTLEREFEEFLVNEIKKYTNNI